MCECLGHRVVNCLNIYVFFHFVLWKKIILVSFEDFLMFFGLFPLITLQLLLFVFNLLSKCILAFCNKYISGWRNKTGLLCRGNIAPYKLIQLAPSIEKLLYIFPELRWKEQIVFIFFFNLVRVFLLVHLQSPVGDVCSV